MSLIELTGAERRVVATMRPELHALEWRWMSCLTRTQQRSLGTLVAKLQANVPALD